LTAQFLARAARDRLDRGLYALPMRRERDDHALAVDLIRLLIALDELGGEQNVFRPALREVGAGAEQHEADDRHVADDLLERRHAVLKRAQRDRERQDTD